MKCPAWSISMSRAAARADRRPPRRRGHRRRADHPVDRRCGAGRPGARGEALRARGHGAPPPISTSGSGGHWGEQRAAGAVARCLGRPGASRGSGLLHHGIGPWAGLPPRHRSDDGVAPRGREALGGIGRRRRRGGGGPRLAAGPAALRADPVPRSAPIDRGPGPSRPPLHDARTVARALCRDDPRLHVLRPPGMARPIKGAALSKGNPSRLPAPLPSCV